MKAKVFISALIFLAANNLFSQWHEQVSNTTNWLHHVHFIDINTGIVCGSYGTILKTSNGGINWTVQHGGDSTDLLSCILLDANTGFAVGNTKILKTTNGGLNWNTTTLTLHSEFNTISFLDNNTGFALGSETSIYRTTNTGQSWINLSPNPFIQSGNNYEYSQKINDTLIIACGSTFNIHESIIAAVFFIYHNGSDIDANHFGPMGSQIDRLFFAGYAGFFNMLGATYKTTNSGFSWAQINQYSDGFIAFYNDVIGIRYDGVNMYYTSNTGTNWVIQQVISQQYDIADLKMLSDRIGIAVGVDGKILKNDNIVIGIQPISTEIPKQFSLSQNYPNPFNPNTKIRFEIPGTPLSFGEGLGVGLHVYNALGQQIATLVNEQLKPGTYSVEFNAADYPSGVYFYKLVVGDPSSNSGQGFAETKKMVLIK